MFFKQHIGSGEVYTGFDAKEEKVWKKEIENARYLVFATHGILAKEAESNLITEPALVLTLVDNPEGYDGLLGMSEVAGLRLNADLAILSACNSAGENGRGGEGFVGMARSFLFAGSKAVVASHWKVEDQATLNLMREFSKRLKKKGLLDALSTAKRKMRKKVLQYGKNKKIKVSCAHPFFWAAFVLIGER
jgi:CHAT domain-containing protein